MAQKIERMTLAYADTRSSTLVTLEREANQHLGDPQAVEAAAILRAVLAGRKG